jgi:integrase
MASTAPGWFCLPITFPITTVPGMATQTRQRGSVRVRGSKYEVRVYAGLDPLTKKPIYLNGSANTSQEAEKVRTALLAKVDQQRHPKSRITVGQVIDRWMEIARHEESTRERNEIAIRMYLRPAFGEHQAAKLHAYSVELFYARLARCRNQCEGRLQGRADPATGEKHECRGLSNGYLRKLHYILKAAFDRAVRWDYLSESPMDLVPAPPEDDPEPDPPTNAEAARLLNDAWQRDLAWGTLLFLVMVTGLRRGELCGLRWVNVDFEAKVIMIRRATSSRGRLKKTKTRRIRRIAIDDITVAILRAHFDRCRELAAAVRASLSPESFVFSQEPDGSEPLKKNSVTQRYRRTAERLGLSSRRIQSLRDYSVTELIVAGADLRTVSGRHGHSRGATTLKHYAAWVEEADRRAAEILPARLPSPQDAPPPPLSRWEEITAELRASIEDGSMRPGEEFLTVADIAATYGVSQGTAHRTVAQLRKEGLIVGDRGRRPVVAEHSSAAPRPWIGVEAGQELQRHAVGT